MTFTTAIEIPVHACITAYQHQAYYMLCIEAMRISHRMRSYHSHVCIHHSRLCRRHHRVDHLHHISSHPIHLHTRDIRYILYRRRVYIRLITCTCTLVCRCIGDAISPSVVHVHTFRVPDVCLQPRVTLRTTCVDGERVDTTTTNLR